MEDLTTGVLSFMCEPTRNRAETKRARKKSMRGHELIFMC